MEEDRFERSAQGYQDRWESDALARRTRAPVAQPTQPKPIATAPPQKPVPTPQRPSADPERARLHSLIASLQSEETRLKSESDRLGKLTISAAQAHQQSQARYYSMQHLGVLNQLDDVQFKLKTAQEQLRMLEDRLRR
jgi:hypothetical protein